MEQTSGPTRLVWRDGQLIDWRDATIHVMSHVAHYGSCVFEGIRCYETPDGPAIFRLREHMRRLADSARIYRIPMHHGIDALCEASVEVVAANGVRHCYLRPLVARTGEQMGVLPDDRFVETFIVAWIWGTYLGEGALENGVDVCVSSWRRAAPDTFPSLGKAGGAYLNSQIAKMRGEERGFAEAIMLDTYGYVAEGTGQNLFVVRDGVLFTPPISANILAGITRDCVIRIAKRPGLRGARGEPAARVPVRGRRGLLHRHRGRADADPLAWTACRWAPAAAARSPPRSRTRFLGIARGELPDTYGWLTHVPATAGATA